MHSFKTYLPWTQQTMLGASELMVPCPKKALSEMGEGKWSQKEYRVQLLCKQVGAQGGGVLSRLLMEVVSGKAVG